jgi:hypothetical protein
VLDRIFHHGRDFASPFRGKRLLSWQIQFVPGKTLDTQRIPAAGATMVKYPG